MRFLNKLLLLSLFLLILTGYAYPQEHLIWNFEGTEGLRWAFNQFTSNAGTHGAGNPNSVVNPAPDAVNSSDSCASVKAEVTGSGNGILMYIDYKGGAIDVSVRKMLHIKMKCDQAYTWRAKLTDRNGERSVLTYADYTEVGSWQDLVFNFDGQFETSDGGYFDSTGVYQIEFSAGSPFDLNADVFLDDIRFNADPEPYGKVMTHDLWNFEGIEGLRWNYSQFSSNAGSHGAGNPNSVVNPAPDAVNSSDSCASIKAEVSGSGNGILMYIAYKGGAIDVSELKMLHIKMKCDSAHTWRAKLTDRNGQRSVLTYADYTQVNSWQDLVFNFKGQFVTTDGTPLDSTGVYQIEMSAGEPFDLNTDVFLDEIRFNNDPNPYGGVVPEEPTTPTLAVQESVQSGEDYLVNWTGSINHTRYLLEEDTTDLFASAEPFYLDAGTTSMVFNKVVENDQTFYYRVRAENETTDLMSDWSNVGSTTITTDTTTEAKEHIAYDFEGINNTVQWQLVDFTSVPGTTDDWKAFPYSIENPQKVGINTSDSCGHFTAEVESGPQQITIWLTMPNDWVDVTDMQYLHIKMRCEKGAQWKVQLYDGANRTSYVVTEYTNIGQWQDLVFDFEHADLLGADLGTVRHLKFRYEGEMPFYADSLLFDDVKFSSSPVPEGEVPGPTVPELTAPYAALSNDGYSVNWTAAENHTGYVLQEALSDNFSGATEFTFDETVTEAVFTNTVDQTKRFYYRIKAVSDDTGKEGSWSETVATIVVPDTAAPIASTLSGGGRVDSGENYTLEWTASTNQTRYQIQEATSSDFSDATDLYTDYDEMSMVFNHVVSEATDYYYRVRAENELSGKMSEWSNLIDATIYPVSVADDLECGTTYRGKIIPENYDNFPEIAAGGWWVEQPYNTKIIRCTDTGETNNVYSYHRYSSVCVFNHTGDYFITFHREPEVWLHDGRNGVPLRKLKINQTTCVWSMVEKEVIYYLDGNKLRSYNVMTDEDALVREFVGEVDMDIGGNEGDISNDGRYICFSSTNRTRWFVYDLFDDIKHDVFVADNGAVDAAQISPSGKYVVIEYALKAANDYQEGVGCCVHDAKTMQFIRNIYYPKTQHNDVGYDNDGDEAMFITDVQGDFAGGGPSSVVSIKLETAEKKVIHSFDERTWTIFHHSQRSCVGRNDYVFSSMYVLNDFEPSSDSWKPFWNEILAVPTDTSKETVRLAPTRVNMQGSKKWALEPRASANRQGDRVVYTSNLNGENTWSDVFMITLEEPDTLAPFKPENLIVSNNSYNEVTITWDPPVVAEDGDLARNYKVMRDTTLLGYVLGNSFTDTTVFPNNEYTYKVYSLDESAVESVEPATVTVTTGEDTDPPELVKVVPLGLRAVAVHFNEELDPESALNQDNYEINNGIIIGRMALACKRAVLIETSDQVAGNNYSISVSNIRDNTSHKNEMPATEQKQFTAQEGSEIGFTDFSDDFDAGDTGVWEINNPEIWGFLEDQGRNVFGTTTSNIQSPGPGLLGAFSLVKDQIYADFTLTCDAYSPDGNSGADFAFIWNFRDEFNYNYVMFNRFPHLNELFVVSDSTRITINDFGDFTRFDEFASAYHTIKVQVKSGHFTVSMDDSVLVEGDDETFLYGKVGIGSFNDWVYFDNFQLTVDTELMTKIEEETAGTLPGEYKLNQNYPNPFNPTTMISYSIPRAEKVQLTVYNVIGQKLETLVDKKQAAGEYQIMWDSAEFPSGVYFYELKTDSFSQKKKMILLK